MRFREFFLMLNEISNSAINKAKQKLSSLPNPGRIDINDYLDRFKILHDKNKIKGVDIMTLTPETLKQLVQQSEIIKSHKEKDIEIKKDAIKVFENDKCIVVKPLTFEASCKYGAHTKWCTTATKIYFDSYAHHGGLYYIIPKDISEKMAEISYINQFNIPIEIFKNEPIEFKWENVKNDEDINAGSRNLKSLKGAPVKVIGNFYCYKNQLITLEGAPIEIGGSFACNDNQLTTLEYSPQIVGENYYCQNNRLSSIKGIQTKINGQFDCGSNQLTTLEGAPEEVGNGFNCSDNKLKSLIGAPKIILHGDFRCNYNFLSSLEGAPKEVGGNFLCGHNNVKFTIADVKKVCNVKGNIYV
jgi:hypothetical protein